jgi:hypothetical protein
MKIKPLASLAAFLAFSSLSHAATVTWGAATNIPTSDSEFIASVANNGTFLSAVNFGVATSSTTSINGVTFRGSGTFPVGSAASIPISGSGMNGTGWTLSAYSPSTTLTTLPQTLGDHVGNVAKSLLDNFISGSGSGSSLNPQGYTLTFTGLQEGSEYQFQLWATDSRSNTGTTQSNIEGGGPKLDNNIWNTEGAVGQYVIGTFVAGGGSQSITYQNSSNAYGPLNAFALHQVPEPSSGLLLAVAAMGVVRRRR